MPALTTCPRFVRNVLTVAAFLLGAAIVPTLAPAAAHAQGVWDYVGVIDGVKVWRKEVPESNLMAFKGEIVADVNIGKLLAVFLDRNQRKFWVDRFDDTKMLEQTGPLNETYWIRFKLPPGISNRDYVLRADGTVDPALGLFTAKIKSVTHPKAPADDCCVRAEVKGTFYRFEALKGAPGTPDKTRLVVEVMTDPKGWLPGWVVNLIQKSWPSKTLNGLVRRSNNASVVPIAEYAAWHTRP